jgi:flagellar protein FliL
MVKPSQPKGIKPKADLPEIAVESGSSTNMDGKKLIIVNAVITALICFLFIGSNYFIVNSVISSSVSKIAANSGSADSSGDGSSDETADAPPERGVILDLGEFILNLSDPNSKRYLKVNVALELSRAASDPPLDEGKGGGGSSVSGHGGGGEGAKVASPLEIIQAEMEQYKPAIRDAIISVLSSKTAEELSSLSGKELAKEQIKAAVDPLFGGEREVMRVSFGTFIIQ